MENQKLLAILVRIQVLARGFPTWDTKSCKASHYELSSWPLKIQDYQCSEMNSVDFSLPFWHLVEHQTHIKYYIWKFAIEFSSATWPRIWLQLTSFTWLRCETPHRLQCISKLWSKVHMNCPSTHFGYFYIVINLFFFFFFLNFCLDQGPFCGATDCSCFGLCVSFLMGYKPFKFAFFDFPEKDMP